MRSVIRSKCALFKIKCRSVFFTLMLFLLVLIVGTVKLCTPQGNSGTTLFRNKLIDTDCWTKEEVNKIRARKFFNQIIPELVTPDQISKTFIKDALRYYREALRTVDKQAYSQTTSVLREALADTIGGHLRSELLPAARLAYYAGYVPYKHVRDLHYFYDELKMILNTEGRGWKAPPKIPQIANMTVLKITIGPGKLFNPCDGLVIKRDGNGCILLPTPKVDDADEPSAIALPFKNGGLINLVSPSSKNILLTYYTTASRCILRRSPATCRHSDIVNFNNDLWSWMKSEIAPHLMDEKLYAAYGGVLRIAAAVQNYGKVLSRRNPLNFYSRPDLKWVGWRTITEPYLYIDSDWPASFYVAIVIVVAMAICLLQILYTYLFGSLNSCSCMGKKQSSFEDPENLPTGELKPLDSTTHIYHNESQHLSCSLRQIQCSSNNPVKTQREGSTNNQVKTQRVYDFNENLLDVIMSDAEDIDYCSSESENEYVNTKRKEYESETKKATRSTSPPKIETSIEQLKINKGRVGILTGASEARDKWGRAEASSSASSGSSGSSTSRPRTRAAPAPAHARELLWARRVLASELARSPRTKSTLHTEMDSYTTSTSRR